jgi:hypothetical protein
MTWHTENRRPHIARYTPGPWVAAFPSPPWVRRRLAWAVCPVERRPALALLRAAAQQPICFYTGVVYPPSTGRSVPDARIVARMLERDFPSVRWAQPPRGE